MSRILDALKRAEAERATPSGAGTLEHPVAAETEDGLQFGSADAPLSYAGPTAAESAPKAFPDLSSLPTDRIPRMGTNGFSAPVCSAALLERCVSFDGSPIGDNETLAAGENKYRVGAEEFRSLRSSLNLARKQQPLKSILVTSPLPREGKTFVALNLAQTLTWQREQRVLLIDGDLRISRIHTVLRGLPQKPGLADYLARDVDPISLIHRANVGNFFALPAGQTVSNAPELVGNGRLRALIQWLSPAFDWIIVDAPPSVPVADARVMAEACDGVLFVVRAGYTPSDLAKQAVQEYKGKRVVGVVLNSVEARKNDKSYYGYYGDGKKAKGKKRA